MCSVLFLPVQMFQKLSCLPRVCRFCSCLCKVCSRVSEARSVDFVSLSLLTNNFLRQSFLVFPVFSSSRAFLFFSAKAWPLATVTNWPLHVHYRITLWAYLSEALVKGSHKRLSSTENPHTYIHRVLKSRDHTLPLRTCNGEVYGNITREESG